MMYLKPEYLAESDLKKGTVAISRDALDSARLVREKQLAFTLHLESLDGKKNVLWYNIESPAEYQDRVNTLSFHMQEFIAIKSQDGEVHHPVFAQYENLSDPSGRVKIMFSFSLDKNPFIKAMLEKMGHIQVDFEDPFWKTGTHHFLFDEKELNL